MDIGANRKTNSHPFLMLVRIINTNPTIKEKIRIQYFDFSFKGVFEKFIDLYEIPSIPSDTIKTAGIIIFNE